jgi:N-acetylglucosaminyldiphosphoundecaprenol N-acetyl-beta-D-mannosaminyltransferase
VPELKEATIASSAARQSRIFELPIELGHPDELMARIVGWVGSRGKTKRIMYVNAHVLNQSREDPGLRMALEQADLVYCDGYGVRLAAKALSTEIPHRMTGADWIWDLAALCEKQDSSMYLLGCDPGVAAQAGQRLRRAHPKLRIVGTHHGYFNIGSGHDERVIEDINARKPDILLVGMGTPQQEVWVQRHFDQVDATVVWTVGALFEYVSGRIRRAPHWMSDNGLEWIFRLAVEPRRMWRRYLLGNPVFLHRVLEERQRRTQAPL